MGSKPWHASHWPDGVPWEISGYQKPIFSLLDRAAGNYPNHAYTIFNGATRTFLQVREAADRIACFLARKGIKKGDRVAIFLPNLPHYPAIYFGILKAGAICATCNPVFTADELKYQIVDAGVKVVFCMDHPVFYRTAVQAVEGTGVETIVICNVKTYLPRLKRFFGDLLGKIPHAEKYQPGHLLFEEVLASCRPEPPAVEIDPARDLASILYTGGTTGVPKGAALTHANIMFNLMALEEWLRVRREPGAKPEKLRPGGAHCYLGLLPWYHSFGQTVIMLGACYSGNRLVCIPDPRAGNPPFTEVLKAIQKYRATILPAVPTIMVALNNHSKLRQYDLSSLKACFCGGAPLSPEVCRRFEENTGAIVFEGWGLTETAPVASANPTDTAHRKIGSVGLPMPSTDIKIVDGETGLTELPQGEDGEMAISGPQVMQGYWNRPEEDQAVFREINGRRFFLSGDIGHMDKDGFFFITERKKDMIIVGGFNVYPKEVEEVLYTHPKVQLAAVIGLPDPKSGEAVKAFVQLKAGQAATEKEILDFCKERMAGYKRPRQVEFRNQIPTSMVGKVLRRVLRDEELRRMADSGQSEK
jgi:long-chain acyl-CoA synthetase